MIGDVDPVRAAVVCVGCTDATAEDGQRTRIGPIFESRAPIDRQRADTHDETSPRRRVGAFRASTSPAARPGAGFVQATQIAAATVAGLMAMGDDPGRRHLAAHPVLTPFLKWPGGKSGELPAIAAAAPELTGRYIDPFVGGASILLAVPEGVEAWANDAAPDLMELYQAAAAERPTFSAAAWGVAQAWNELAAPRRGLPGPCRRVPGRFESGLATVSDYSYRQAFGRVLRLAGTGLEDTLARALSRISRSSSSGCGDTGEPRADALRSRPPGQRGGCRAGGPLHGHPDPLQPSSRALRPSTIRRLADFLFLREFAYAAMFRFNARGEFQRPVWRRQLHRKSLAGKPDALFGAGHAGAPSDTTWRCTDFETFLEEAAPAESDFLFVDPPYDSDFSDYDGRHLAKPTTRAWRTRLEGHPGRVMLVIKDTPAIRRLYTSDRWQRDRGRQDLPVDHQSRNDRRTTHLTITNYQVAGA